MPEIIYWDKKLDISELEFQKIPDIDYFDSPQAIALLDRPIKNWIIPLRSLGYRGSPGLIGSHQGKNFSPQLTLESYEFSSTSDSIIFNFFDASSQLRSAITFNLVGENLLKVNSSVTNNAQETYQLDSLKVQLPLEIQDFEIMDFSGTWCKERTPQRHNGVQGRFVREQRRGRTGHDASLLMLVGTNGFRNESGSVWGAHIAWSGDHELFVEKMADGHTVIGASELLESGEIQLGKGQSYSTPDVYFAWSDTGLNTIAQSFQGLFLVDRKAFTPVIYNSWESVYFDISEKHLKELALKAQDIGVERFVIDDGWFKGRRDANAGLGDWIEDPKIFPNGLSPVIDFVNQAGMEFGLWVEPEMINTDSDLFRSHPDWWATGGSPRARELSRRTAVGMGSPPPWLVMSFGARRCRPVCAADIACFLSKRKRNFIKLPQYVFTRCHALREQRFLPPVRSFRLEAAAAVARLVAQLRRAG